MGGDTSGREPTVLAFSPAGRVLVLLGPAAAGVLVAVLAPILARWLVSAHFPVLGVVWRLVGSVDTWWKVAVQAVILAVLGALASVEIVRRSTRVTVGPGEVRLQTGDREVAFARPQIDFVFMDGSFLVILDRESRQLFHGEPQAESRPLEQTFMEYGYPWHDEDPFTGLYQPWIPGGEQLPVAVEAVLSARAVALRKKATREAAELRDSLEKLGYAVRDDGDRQLWRPLVRS
ncbi:YqeB family protein [Actinoplanes sp. CA-252034]|uniref:YqeB family protein n=1 Tax=Actinoplanes sp. CA-252034 TaxID=3239906 RepID=UPI003D988E7B